MRVALEHALAPQVWMPMAMVNMDCAQRPPYAALGVELVPEVPSIRSEPSPTPSAAGVGPPSRPS